MISTKKILTNNKFLRYQKSNVTQKQKLVARWKKVDGKLICQWIIE